MELHNRWTSATRRRRRRPPLVPPRRCEGYAAMGLSADLVEAILHNYEPELVGAAHERRARELLGLSRRDPTPTAAQCEPHKSELGALPLADAVGYDLWTVAPKISKRYATTSPRWCSGGAQRGAGLARTRCAACAPQRTASCRGTWWRRCSSWWRRSARRRRWTARPSSSGTGTTSSCFMIRQVKVINPARHRRRSFCLYFSQSA